MTITRNIENATWTEEDAAAYNAAIEKMKIVTSLSNRHFHPAEILYLKSVTKNLNKIANKFDAPEDCEHVPIEMEAVNEGPGITREMDVIYTPGWQQRNMWYGHSI